MAVPYHEGTSPAATGPRCERTPGPATALTEARCARYGGSARRNHPTWRSRMSQIPPQTTHRYGTHGRVLVVDLTARTSRVEDLDESVYQLYLGGYGLGAYLMWKHFPPRADALAPEACFAIVSGLLTGVRTPFSGRIQIVGKSPLTGTWADSNSGGSVASQLRRAGFDALLVTGRASEPTVLVVRDGEVLFEPAGALWGKEIPPVFDDLREKFGHHSEVGVSAIGPAGEKQSRIASVMNDRYH